MDIPGSLVKKLEVLSFIENLRKFFAPKFTGRTVRYDGVVGFWDVGKCPAWQHSWHMFISQMLAYGLIKNKFSRFRGNKTPGIVSI